MRRLTTKLALPVLGLVACCLAGSAAAQVPVATSIYVPDRTGPRYFTIVLKAYLYARNPDLAWVAGKELRFQVDGTTVGFSNTDVDGRAELVYTVPEGGDLRSLGATWVGDGNFAPSNGSGTLTVTQGTLYVWVYPRTVNRGSNTYLRAYVRRLPDLQWISGKQIGIYMDGSLVNTDVTDENGRASTFFAVPADWSLGDHVCTAEFQPAFDFAGAIGTGIITCIP